MSVPYAPISNIVPWTQAIAGLNQAIYSTNWTANTASDILVYSRLPNIPASDALQLVPSTNYTVQFIGANNIVQVTFIPSAIPLQYNIITIMRATPSQFLNLYTNTNFVPSMLNGDFETLTLVDQQNQLFWEQIVPRYNNSATVNVPIDTILPVLKANEFWIKNSTNTAFIAATLGSGDEFPVLGPFVLYAANSSYPEGFNLGGLADGFLAQTSLLGVATPFTIPFPLDVIHGGSGLSSITPFALLLGGTTNTSPFAPLADIGAAGEVLTSSGPGLPPSWQSFTQSTVFPQISFLPTTSGIIGTTNGDDASAGIVGEEIFSQILFSSAIALTTNTNTNITSINLTPGDWDIEANANVNCSVYALYSITTWINDVSAVAPDISLRNGITTNNTLAAIQIGFSAPTRRFSITANKVIYLSVSAQFLSGTASACGTILARRVR